MKNIFSMTTAEIFSALTDYFPSQTGKDDPLGYLFFRYIPLHDDFTLSFEKFRSNLISKIKALNADTDIESLADLALDLCSPYLHHLAPKEPEDPAQKIAFKINSPQSLLQDFQDKIYDGNTYYSDLKTFMVLSYVYNQDCQHDHITKKFISSYFNKRKCKSSPNFSNLGRHSRHVYDKLSAIQKTQKENYANSSLKPHPFMDGILNYTKKELSINNYYDIDVFLGLIFSPLKKSNPFISSPKKSLTSTTSFIDSFAGINLSNDLPFTLLEQLETNKISEARLTEHKIHIFNQFLLERLGCFNFINSLHATLQPVPNYLQNSIVLLELVNCPLLHFRLDILKLYKAYYKKHFSFNLHLLSLWNDHLLRFIRFHISCTLPILDLTFHYLAHHATTNSSNIHSFHKSIDTFFESLDNSNHFKFYEYKNTTNFEIKPNLHPFPADTTSTTYKKLSSVAYAKLAHDSCYIPQNFNILDTLGRIDIEMKKHLKNNLVISETSLE